jgi:TrmH family RNA methyltransferase
MDKITSRDNPKLKHARKVRDGKATDEIFVEGLRLCEEALRSGAEIHEAFVSSSFGPDRREAALVKALEMKHLAAYEIDDKLVQSIADTKNSQGVIFICRRPDTSGARFTQEFSEKPGDLAIFLNRINNPANLGAILRTAEAAGAAGVIVSSNSTEALSPKSLRASMGSALRLNIWENAEFDEVIRWADEYGLIATAADITAEVAYTEIDWNKPRLLVFGSEAYGLDDAELEMVDEKIKIAMENNVESLNLAVSCGVILFEAKRQRSSSG